MKKHETKGTLKRIENFFVERESTILLISSISGLISMGVFTFKAGQKFDKIMDDYKAKMDKAKNDEEKKELRKALVVVLVKTFFGSVAFGGLSVASMIAMNKNLNKKVALLTTAYDVMEKSLKDTNEKAKEVVGEKKVSQIRDAIAKDKVNKKIKEKPAAELDSIDDSYTWCQDAFSGKYFKATPAQINKAIAAVSAECINSTDVTLREFYEELGLFDMGGACGSFGWTTDDLVSGLVPIVIRPVIAEDPKIAGEPILYIDTLDNLKLLRNGTIGYSSY